MYVYVWFVLISFEVVELLHYCCSTLYACAVCIHHSTNGLNGECFLGESPLHCALSPFLRVPL